MAQQTNSFLVPLVPPSKKNNNVIDKPKKAIPEYSEPDWGGFRSLPTPFKFEILKSGTIIEEQLVFDTYQEQSVVLVGRLPTCDLSLNHESVSRNHAVLQQRASDGALFVYDLGSTHGTFINKTKIQPKQYYPLKEGDFLKFGNSSRQFILSGGPNIQSHETSSTKEVQGQKLNSNKHADSKSSTQDILDEPASEVENPEEDVPENADLDHIRDNYLDYYLGNAEEDFDDDFYDRTKKAKSKSNMKMDKPVETSATLQVKKKELMQQISVLEQKLKDLEDSQTAADNTDELDAFMSNLTQTVKSEDKKKLENELKNANDELRKIEKLLQLVQPGLNNVQVPPEVVSKQKERNAEKSQPPPKKPKVSKPPLPIFPEPPKSNALAQDNFVPEYDDDYSEVPMQFHLNQ